MVVTLTLVERVVAQRGADTRLKTPVIVGGGRVFFYVGDEELEAKSLDLKYQNKKTRRTRK